MGRLYRDKKSSGCAMCKPYKHGWAKKFTPRELAERKVLEQEAQSTTPQPAPTGMAKRKEWHRVHIP